MDSYNLAPIFANINFKKQDEMDKKPTNYLRIDNSGKLYSLVDGSTPNATGVKLKDGKISYRLYRNQYNSTITGKLKRPYFKTVNFQAGDVQMVYFFIENETTSDCLSFPLFTSNGGLNPYVKSMTQIIGKIDPEKDYYIRPATKMKKNGFVSQNIYVIEAASKEWVKLPEEEFKARPQPIIKERADGKKLYDFTDQDNFLYKAFMDGIEAVYGALSQDYVPQEQVASADTVSTMITPQATVPPVAPAPTDFDDDLPF